MNHSGSVSTPKRKTTYRSRDTTSNNPLFKSSPSPMNWIEDGVDHINISDTATTTLGQALELRAKIPFKHSIFGNFDNIESFWFYIRSEERDDRLRCLSGVALSKFVKTLTLTNVRNFKAIILDSMYQRIYQSPVLFDEVVKSTLPFEYYHTNESGIRIRPNFFKWMITGLEEIRASLKEDRDPDFYHFMDDPHNDMYHYVVPAHLRKKV